jgi:hypothetical protein
MGLESHVIDVIYKKGLADYSVVFLNSLKS